MLIFTLSVLGLLALPGPTNTLLATAGTLMGARKAIRLIPAELAGYLLAIGLITLALRPIIGAHPEVAKMLRLVASGILIVLAVRLWRSRVSAVGAIRPWQVFITTLFNPKALVFALSIIPHLIDGDLALAAPYLVAFSMMVVLVASAWASFGGLLNRRSLDPGAIRRVSAVVLCVFAAIISSSVFWPH